METKIAVRESEATAKHFTDIKIYNSGTGMETKITNGESTATDKYFTDIKKYNSDSKIYTDERSGVINLNFLFISKADRLTILKKLYYKYFPECKTEYVKVTVFPVSLIYNKGRKLYIRTGESPRSLRNSPPALIHFPGYGRVINEVSGGLSNTLRSISGYLRKISKLLRYFSDE